MSKTVSATFMFSGNGQYYGGHSDQDNEIQLSTSFGPHTNVKEAVDGWLDDWTSNCSAPEAFDGVDDDDVKKALIEMFLPAIGAQYEQENGPPLETLTKYVEVQMKMCPECVGSGSKGNVEDDDVEDCEDCEGSGRVEDEDADYDLTAIVLLTVTEED